MPSMPSKGPISLQGGGAVPSVKPSAEEAPTIRFRILASGASCSGLAAAHPDSCAVWAPFLLPGGACHAELASGSDCVAGVRADAAVPLGCLSLDAALQHSLHAATGECLDFRLFTPPQHQPFALTDLEVEVRLLSPPHDCPPVVEADERKLGQAVLKRMLGLVVAVGQLLVLDWQGAQIVARVTAANTLDRVAREEAVAYHCFRGLVTPDTAIYLTVAPTLGHSAAALPDSLGSMSLHPPQEVDDASSGDEGDEDALGAGRGTTRLVLISRLPRPAQQASAAYVDVHTNDGEVFPVKRKLLRPCIALTSAVRADADGPPCVAVDVGTLAFDRVLIFLETMALGQPAPSYAVHLAEELLTAARTLKLRSLEGLCSAKLGQAQSRLRVYSFDEVCAANAAGNCWLLIDGMVMDVGSWLPEHPGGSTIIPAQGLNLDASRMFEVYHVSRESFLYLKEFYIGELAAEDVPFVPCSERPSPDFLQQLREFTPWRMAVQSKTYKSF